ncbi:MAG: hypothetical protein ACI4R9_06450 [Kiritimatiellia bacterium]
MEQKAEMTNSNAGAAPTFRPKLSFFHSSPKGTGCVLMMELRPACGLMEGCFMMTLANQLTAGDRRSPHPVYPTFDMENRIVVKLGFLDIVKMLQVFRGECASINADKGLYHRTSQFSTQITLRHLVEPLAGYALDVFRRGGADDRRAGIVLTPAEALGLSKAIEGSLGVLCFGIPMVTAYERQQGQTSRPAAMKGQEGHGDVRAA